MIDLGLSITSLALRNRHSGVGSLSPLIWFDPSDKGTLFQDAAGTIPVTASGEPVGRMNDKSGNGHHAVQSINANRRPTFFEDANGRRYLNFDGIDDELSAGALPFSEDATNVTAFRLNSFNAAHPHVISNRISGPSNYRHRQPLVSLQNGTTLVRAAWGALSSSVSVGQSPIGLDMVLSSWTTGTDRNINANGIAKDYSVAEPIADGGSGPFEISGGNRAAMRFYGTFQANRKLSDDEIALVRRRFSALSGGRA
ncbi:hypothetical protein [Ruegeria halocynthiae]|uniref:hypothetical protein n=1 Tax=Ruegeria halocynthiae TaxID=985054 RepID=UPI00056BCE89|nr:hypothetical protein [Ruegeria halocynthiae]